MARGGGRGGGSRGGGGFSRGSSGGSRGFSSGRSSSSSRSSFSGSSSGRGGGASFGSSRPASRPVSRPSYPHRPAGYRPIPVRPRPIYGSRPVIIYNNGDRTYGNNQHPYAESRYEQNRQYQQSQAYEAPAAAAKAKKKKAIPGWYIFASVIMAIVIVFMLFMYAGAKSYEGDVAREPLAGGVCISIGDTVDDRLGWISNKAEVERGLDYFYEETGVQPYLLICDNLDGYGADITDAQAQAAITDLYNSLFNDEGHLIFVFMEYEPNWYYTFVYTGTAANTVIDDEARDVLINNADMFYTDSDLSDEAYFAKIFTEGADVIMEDPAEMAEGAGAYLIIALVLLAAMIGGFIYFKRKEAKRLEAEELQKILETPIEPLRSAEDEELLRKYSDETKED